MKQILSLLILTLLNLNMNAQSEDERCTYNFLSKAPKEHNRDRLMEGDNYGNPYTMFVKEPGFNLGNSINTIANQITDGQPINIFELSSGKLYYDLYNYALRNDINPCYKGFEGCTHANWVKANAIIYLIKLRPTYFSANYVTFYSMDSDSAEFYANRAFIGLSNLNPKIKNCVLGGDNCGNIRNRALELMQYLQAYFEIYIYLINKMPKRK
jgi:hypothetical protein